MDSSSSTDGAAPVVVISPRGSSNGTTQCLQTASHDLDSSVFVAACASPPTAKQTWLRAVKPPSPPGGKVYAGVCVRCDISGVGTCLTVNTTNHWALTVGGTTVADGEVEMAMEAATPAAAVAAGNKVGSTWTSLQLTASGNTISPVVNGKPLPQQQGTGAGMVALVSGYHVAYYDNFSLHASTGEQQ